MTFNAKDIMLGVVSLFFVLALTHSVFTAQKLDKTEKQLATVQQQLRDSQSNNVLLREQIAKQNGAVEKLKADADKAQKDSAAQLKAAQAQASKHKRKANELMLAQKPANTSDCDAANQLIAEVLHAK